MRSKKNKKKMMIAIILGIVATAGIFNIMNGQKAALEAQMAQQQAAAMATMQSQQGVAPINTDITDAIVAKTDIKAGEMITINKVERKEYKKTDLPSNYFLNENFVLGKVVAVNIPAGKIFTSDDIIAGSEKALDIPEGMRAITIPASSIQGLTSYIFVGSRVDLIAIKSPPEFIAQNIKIIAMETDINTQAAATPVPEAAPAPAAPAAPTTPGAAVPSASSAPAPANETNAATAQSVSADKATGITVLIPISLTRKVIDSMTTGKIQVLLRGNNDTKIYKQTVSYSSFSSHGKSSGIATGKLPPPPSGTGTLPSVPRAIGTSSIASDKPKTEVEIITGSSKSTQSFDDTSTNTSTAPSKELKALIH